MVYGEKHNYSKYFQITELDIGLNFDCNIKLHKKGFIHDN